MTPRIAFKLAIFAICLLLASPLIVVVWLEKHLTKSEAVFLGCGQLLALIPGLPGLYMRAAYYFGSLQACSWQTHIGFGTVIVHRGATIGRSVSTGMYCVLGHARIAGNVRLASRVSVPSGKRQHLNDSGALSVETNFDPVAIAEDCWIGEAAVVMDNVGRESIISAGAVVTKPVPDRVLAGGNPARVLKSVDADRNDGERN